MSNISNNPNYVLNIQTSEDTFAIKANKALCGHHQKDLHNAIHSLALNYINSPEFIKWRQDKGLTQEADVHITFKDNHLFLQFGQNTTTIVYKDTHSGIPTEIVNRTNAIYQECMARRRKQAATENTTPLNAHQYTTINPQYPSMNPSYSDEEFNSLMSQMPAVPQQYSFSKVNEPAPSFASSDEEINALKARLSALKQSVPSQIPQQIEEIAIEQNFSIQTPPQALIEILNNSIPETSEAMLEEMDILNGYLRSGTLDEDTQKRIRDRLAQLTTGILSFHQAKQENNNVDQDTLNQLHQATVNVGNAIRNLMEQMKVASPPVSPPESPKRAEEEIFINPSIQNIDGVAQALNDAKSKASFAIPSKYTDSVKVNKRLLGSTHPDPISELAKNSTAKISSRARNGLHGLNDKIKKRKNRVSPESLVLDLEKDINLFNDILKKLPIIHKHLIGDDTNKQQKAFNLLLKHLSPDQNPWIAIALLDDEYRIEQALKKSMSSKAHADLLQKQLEIIQLKEAFRNLYQAIDLSSEQPVAIPKTASRINRPVVGRRETVDKNGAHKPSLRTQ